MWPFFLFGIASGYIAAKRKAPAFHFINKYAVQKISEIFVLI